MKSHLLTYIILFLYTSAYSQVPSTTFFELKKKQDKVQVFEKWAEKLKIEFPKNYESLATEAWLDSDYKVIKLFSDDHFIPFFGVSFIDLTKKQLDEVEKLLLRANLGWQETIWHSWTNWNSFPVKKRKVILINERRFSVGKSIKALKAVPNFELNCPYIASISVDKGFNYSSPSASSPEQKLFTIPEEHLWPSEQKLLSELRRNCIEYEINAKLLEIRNLPPELSSLEKIESFLHSKLYYYYYDDLPNANWQKVKYDIEKKKSEIVPILLNKEAISMAEVFRSQNIEITQVNNWLDRFQKKFGSFEQYKDKIRKIEEDWCSMKIDIIVKDKDNFLIKIVNANSPVEVSRIIDPYYKSITQINDPRLSIINSAINLQKGITGDSDFTFNESLLIGILRYIENGSKRDYYEKTTLNNLKLKNSRMQVSLQEKQKTEKAEKQKIYISEKKASDLRQHGIRYAHDNPGSVAITLLAGSDFIYKETSSEEFAVKLQKTLDIYNLNSMVFILKTNNKDSNFSFYFKNIEDENLKNDDNMLSCLSRMFKIIKPTKSNPTKVDDNFVSDPSGNKYPTIKIGSDTWTAKNLSYQLSSDNVTRIEGGYLYNKLGALSVCQSLGDGWHLPTNEEWSSYLDGYLLLEFDDVYDTGSEPINYFVEKNWWSLSDQVNRNRSKINKIFTYYLSPDINDKKQSTLRFQKLPFEPQLDGWDNYDGYEYKDIFGFYWSKTERIAGLSFAVCFLGPSGYLSRWPTQNSAKLSVRCVKN